MAKREQITIRILPEVNEKITRLAEKQTKSKGVVIEEAMNKVKEPKE